MPYPLPADMARQLLYLAGDKVDFDPWKRKLLEGGWMPRGGSGRSAGGGGRVMDIRDAAIKRRLEQGSRIPTDAERYEAALQAQRSQNTPSFNPQRKPYPPEMSRMIEEPINRYPEGKTDREVMDWFRNRIGPTGSNPMIEPGVTRQSPAYRTPADTAQTSFPRAQEMMALRDKMEMARWGRLLSEQERATLNRPGWEPPQ